RFATTSFCWKSAGAGHNPIHKRRHATIGRSTLNQERSTKVFAHLNRHLETGSSYFYFRPQIFQVCNSWLLNFPIIRRSRESYHFIPSQPHFSTNRYKSPTMGCGFRNLVQDRSGVNWEKCHFFPTRSESGKTS